VGKTLTVADFSLAITLPYARAAHIPLGEFPAVQRWHETLCEIDAWREPFPEIAVAA
jgi:glutathione S-transferase